MAKKNTGINMWGGHFDKAPSELMQEINASINFDKRLYLEDITGSLAHVAMLAKQKIIPAGDAKKIEKGLLEIKDEIEAGKFKFKIELEDIHMNIEARLRDKIGDVAGKLHTARSRNDQVATDLKLFVRKSNDEVIILIKNLIKELHKKALKNISVILPGYTHLQAAQPVSFAHHLHAYMEMLLRDMSRFSDAISRSDQSPLGSAALAGTSFPIDRKLTARKLKFKAPTENSLDSVSDRDFVLDFMSNSAILMSHLSRFAEEIVVWMSEGFKFVTLSDSYTTGSSIMPQKRNPDAAELVRGKTGRVYGNLMGLLTVMKGLPLAYSKDMQEDKEPFFDSYDTVIIALKVMIGMVADMTVNGDKMLAATESGFITATDLADYLVKNAKMPFRDAHHVVGKLVKIAESKNCDLADLSLAEMQEIAPKIKKDIFDVLTVSDSVNSRKSYGGTSPAAIKVALNNIKKKL